MNLQRVIALSLFLFNIVLTLDAQARTAIQNKGSDTLVNVAQAWAEAYSQKDPEVAIAVSGGGSGTGIAAMINGTVDIANSSRKMKEREIEAARENGVEPVEFIVGFDALADGDHIRAVIRGAATNNDGSNKVGFTAPSVEGQAEVIASALAIFLLLYLFYYRTLLGKAFRAMAHSSEIAQLMGINTRWICP